MEQRTRTKTRRRKEEVQRLKTSSILTIQEEVVKKFHLPDFGKYEIHEGIIQKRRYDYSRQVGKIDQEKIDKFVLL